MSRIRIRTRPPDEATVEPLAARRPQSGPICAKVYVEPLLVHGAVRL